MIKEDVRQLYKMIEANLTRKTFLNKVNMSKSGITKLLSYHNWRSISYEIVKNQYYTAKEIVAISKSTMDSICKEPEGGWLQYCYKYTLKDMYNGRIDDIGEEGRNGMIFLYEIMRNVFRFDRRRRPFSPVLDMSIASEGELKDSTTKEEYDIFMQTNKKDYIYEFMRLASEITPFNTLGHVSGVHYIAMHIGRQLRKLGLKVDLPLVSAACATHDIGKFGCKEYESNRVPYLHYYYTDEWLKRKGMPMVAHIASNHSTWDLELENLSVESLLLIYADFRVKSERTPEGKEAIKFHTLEKSYQIILNMLDNVDVEKKARYERVYNKLHDFQRYIESIGISTDINKSNIRRLDWKDAAILTGNEAVERLKYLAVEHNIKVMTWFKNEATFGNILEAARSEKQWKNVRAYINTIEEYYTYMTQMQKEMALNFLFELLVHREGDIRRQAAILMGEIIASYDEEYRKELPKGEEYHVNEKTTFSLWIDHIDNIMKADLKTTEQQRRWMGYTLKITLDSVLENIAEEEQSGFIDQLAVFLNVGDFNNEVRFIILDTLLNLPYATISRESLDRMISFTINSYRIGSGEVKVAALRLIREMLSEKKCHVFGHEDRQVIREFTEDIGEIHTASTAFLMLKIRELFGVGHDDEIIRELTERLSEKRELYANIFRDNLKLDTPWVIKAVNIEFLMYKLSSIGKEQAFYIATHLSNLLKVSERVTVRHIAGNGLIEVFKMLNFDQRNEVAIELLKGLEIGEYQFSKYIPEYLGKLMLTLRVDSFDEIVMDLGKLMESRNSKVASVTLDTLAEVLQWFDVTSECLENGQASFEKRRERILGMIMKGMSDYHTVISQESFMVIGQYAFGSEALSLRKKYEIFKIIHKKMLTLFVDKEENRLLFFNNAATLNHIYRFISDYEFYEEKMNLVDNDKLAFFPGTFDPFSLSHKGIITTIRDLGFDVYVALDEFSWSKKTQPRTIRREIASMSVANEKNVYIFPENIPINISNNRDIKVLKEILPGNEPYIVVGSDVIANASSYRLDIEENSIHTLNHVVFKRESMEEGHSATDREYLRTLKTITGRVVELTLPTHLEDISSTRIRENIDNNRDISSLIDPVVQNFIYDYNLYMREPQYKISVPGKSLNFSSTAAKGIKKYAICDGEVGDETLATAEVKAADTANLYEEFKDQEITAYIRQEAVGKILIIRELYQNNHKDVREPGQLLITELLADALKEDFTYAVYSPECREDVSGNVIDILTRQGFREIVLDGQRTGRYGVDMRNPVTIFKDMSSILKDPFNSNQNVKRVLLESHRRMQMALTRLYPNSLVLSFNSDIMYHKLIEKITEANHVPSKPLEERKLGPYMCVPFGKILTNMVVPNTVTKTLHTEKSFSPDLMSSIIREYPFYATIEDQISTLKSFNREVVLVDDLLHKGYRMRSLDPAFKKYQVNVKKLIVGLLSGRGKDLMTVQSRDVDSVYFVPNLKAWYVESVQYPFIGGDGVTREFNDRDNYFTAINLIMPYVSPKFMRGRDSEGIYNFSMVCLRNAKEIFKVIEEEYQIIFKKKLTLQRLSEVILAPKLPDIGQCLDYDRAIAPSDYIESDIERLVRMGGMMK